MKLYVKCRRHEPEPTVCGGMPWPARCRYCSLVTEDPDAFFVPQEWAEDTGDMAYECPGGSPTGYHVVDKQVRCLRCHHPINPAAVRRGRTSLRAGKDAERAIAKAYGAVIADTRRTGQYGGPDDVLIGDLFIVQSKAGGWFSERVWTELQKLSRTGGRIPTLIVSDRPGPGHPTRRYVIREMRDDIDLHGRTEEP